MKELVLVVLLLSAFSFAANKAAPNPADYTINVHVAASNTTIGQFGCASQDLNVVVDGKNYALVRADCASRKSELLVLELGDYKAKLVKDEHATAYQSIQCYEILFSDGKTAKFDVVGVSE